ncbi:TPM domain-containing protein [Gordonia hydrophobica]|uniref:TPM domain-containing protein n=1 Tax=Gordonia hydrophobica TaxID=40516 RepID=A0ABZ2U5Q2_9ACTN|nr:TPM domain-containing protein [Gordonia hydrophobica]MBM7368760.1 putative membrane protein YgcG [Gordonia hydrophobica]
MISASNRRPAGAALLVLILAVALAALTSIAGPAGTAHAQAPLRMADRVVDTAGVFNETDHEKLEAALDELESNRRIQMWIVYVDDFGSMNPADWARATGDLSDFGDRDVLLAVSTTTGAYRLTAPTPIDDLTPDEIDAVATDALQPELQKKNWAAAAEDTVQGIDDAGGSDSHFWLIVGGIVVVLALILGGLFYLARRRSGDDIDDLTKPDESLTVDELTEEPIDDLHAWSREVLVATDNAVRTSADELTTAVVDLDDADVAPFAAALLDAQRTLASSFELRHRLDTQPGVDNEQRAVLVEIITACSDADSRLDTQVEAFDAKRDLITNADERLDTLADRIAETAARLPGTAATLAALTTAHDAAPIGDVTAIRDNIDLARVHLQFAEDNVDQGREAAALPTDQRGPAGAAIRSAEVAVDTADKLLDAIDSADHDVTGDLETAEARIQLAADFIDTRRGAVGARPRTLLSVAQDLVAVDDEVSASNARQAAEYADEALAVALADVAAWRDQHDHDDSATDAVLTGMLVDSVLQGSPTDATWQAGGHLGYSTGGRSPGSFGGSSTSGRIGTGGRF